MNKFNSVAKRLLTVLIVFALFLGVVTCLLSANQKTTASADTGDAIETASEEREEIFSYIDVFEAYYEQANNRLNELGKDVSFSFDAFCEGYYSHTYDIATYTDFVVEYVNEHSDYFTDNTYSVTPLDSISSSSADAYYILSANFYEVTPASEFEQVPKYIVNSYSNLQTGDIIYETKTIFFNAGHTAIINDLNKNSVYGDYIQTIEAVGGGVQYGFLDDSRMVDFGVVILRVVGATTSQRNNAINFCIEQLGKSYSLNTFRLNTSITSTKWYCSELMYAAYKYVGIDIGVWRDSSGNDHYMQLGCLPSDINNSYNTYRVTVKDTYLGLSIVSKSGSTWTINVTNNYNAYVYCYYNTKMCNFNDAKNWTGLKDIEVIRIAPNSTIPLKVTENWFATSVTFSYLKNGKRLITYANQLNNSSKTLSIDHNII